MVPFLFCATTGLPASDPGDLWTKPKLRRDADGESFACSLLQPGVLPVRLLDPGTVNWVQREAGPSPREVEVG